MKTLALAFVLSTSLAAFAQDAYFAIAI